MELGPIHCQNADLTWLLSNLLIALINNVLCIVTQWNNVIFHICLHTWCE